MSFSFDRKQGLVIVRAELFGPSRNRNAILQLALDTGATSKLVNIAMLVSIGYDPAHEAPVAKFPAIEITFSKEK